MRYVLIIAAIISGLWSEAQDIHFSQFDRSPFNLNPGLTGQFNGAWRFIGNQRNQWRSVTVPYQTVGLAVDAANFQRQGLGAGLSLFHDQAGDSRLRTTIINAMVSHTFEVKGEEGLQISPGLMLGLTSMRIDYSDLRYDNQWTGIIYDPGVDPGEQFARDGRSYLNLNLGVAAKKTWPNDRSLEGGIAVFNLSNPKQSFFDDRFVRLDARTNLHATYTWAIDDTWKASPSMMFMRQGTYREFNIGGTGYYVIEPTSWMYRAVYGGLFYRSRDAGYLVAGMQYDAWNVGLSYDFNLSTLRPASRGRGGLEIAVIYIIPPKPVITPGKRICPDFV